MKKCANCTYTTENDEKFCPSCGGELIADAKAEVVPAQKNPGKSKAIASMILSIVGMILTISAFGSIPGFILGIIGSKLSKQAIAAGDTSVFGRLGKGFGKATVIVSIVFFILFALYLVAYFGFYFLLIFSSGY